MLRRIPYPKALITLVLILALVVTCYRTFCRVTFVSDLGTNGKVSVRFSEPSPWLSGTKTFLQLSSFDREGRTAGVRLYINTSNRNGIPANRGVWAVLDGRPETESTVADLIKAFELQMKDKDVGIPVLEYGDPNTPIGRNYLKPQTNFYSPDWGSFPTGRTSWIWFPRLFSEGETVTF